MENGETEGEMAFKAVRCKSVTYTAHKMRSGLFLERTQSSADILDLNPLNVDTVTLDSKPMKCLHARQKGLKK